MYFRHLFLVLLPDNNNQLWTLLSDNHDAVLPCKPGLYLRLQSALSYQISRRYFHPSLPEPNQSGPDMLFYQVSFLLFPLHIHLEEFCLEIRQVLPKAELHDHSYRLTALPLQMEKLYSR